MLIKSGFEVAQPVDKVWRFFDDIPQVAACLPGAELTEDLGDDKYHGKVAVRMGPVKLQFAGTAQIKERDDAAKRIVVDAAGADEKGRGQAAMLVTATLATGGRGGTRVDVAQDLQLSGAAAQYGRGMISDVTAVLMRDFATNMQTRIDAARARAVARPESRAAPGQRLRHRPARGAAGAGAGVRAASSCPTSPTRAEEEPMMLWWIGNAVLLLVVVPVLVALLNRVLAALERIRGGVRRHPRRRRRAGRRARRRPGAAGHDRQHHPRRLHRRGPLRGLRRQAARLTREDVAMPAAAWVTLVITALIIAAAALGLLRVIVHLMAVRQTLGAVIGGVRSSPTRPAPCPRCCRR